MEIVVVLIVAVAVAVLGVRVGMLVAPRIDRWAAPPEPAADLQGAEAAEAGAERATQSEQHPADRHENASVDDSR